MAVVAAADVVAGPGVGFLPLVSLGPAFAGLVGGWRRTALIGAVALVLCVGLGLYDGLFEERRGFTAMASVAGVTGVGIAAAVMRSPPGGGAGQCAVDRGGGSAGAAAAGAADRGAAAGGGVVHLGRRGGADRRRPVRGGRLAARDPGDRRGRAGQGAGRGGDGGRGARRLPGGGARRAGPGRAGRATGAQRGPGAGGGEVRHRGARRDRLATTRSSSSTTAIRPRWSYAGTAPSTSRSRPPTRFRWGWAPTGARARSPTGWTSPPASSCCCTPTVSPRPVTRAAPSTPSANGRTCSRTPTRDRALEALREDLVRHAAGPLHDDAAMLLLRYHGHGEGKSVPIA